VNNNCNWAWEDSQGVSTFASEIENIDSTTSALNEQLSALSEQMSELEEGSSQFTQLQRQKDDLEKQLEKQGSLRESNQAIIERINERNRVRAAIAEKEAALGAARNDLTEYQANQMRGSKREDFVAEIEFMDKQIETLQEVIDNVKKAAQLDGSGGAGAGTVDTQQLAYTAGSTAVSVSRALVMLANQRDSIFQAGIAQGSVMVQNMLASDEQAKMSEDQASKYMQLSNMQARQREVNMLFQGLGLLGGAALMMSPLGATLGVGGALALGGSAGSFLGNVFSR
jgi:DNA repair exonuclease SbcCD ATPase subunit